LAVDCCHVKMCSVVIASLVTTTVTWTDKMIALSTLASAVVLGLTALAIFAQLGESERTRLAALLADLSRRWDEDLLRTARIEMARWKPGEIRQIVEAAYLDRQSDHPEFYKLEALANFLETLGVLEAQSGGLTLELIDSVYGSSVLNTWKSWQPSVDYLRSLQPRGRQTAYESFERLYLEIRERRANPPG
jgi:hypothetical protein